MTDELSFSDLEGEIVKRDSNGEILPETSEVTLPNGATREIKHKPITTGLLNEISDFDTEIGDLEPDAVYEAFQTIYLSDAVLGLSKEDVRDMRAGALQALLQPLEEQVEEEFGDEEGNLATMDKTDRAAEMRQ